MGAFTVGGGLGKAGAAIRWFELRNTGSGWSLYQESTFDPGDGKDRFFPSVAMDGVGNIAMGYSVSSDTMHPSMRYSVHRIDDTLGTMLPEATMIAGGGSQTGSNRWGDYSSMSIDPADDQSFWYTSEYYSANSSTSWKTRIGKFKIINSLSLSSVGAQDGTILESTETSGVGGTMNSAATTFFVGDSVGDKQYRAILSFNTSALPDTAYITGVKLKIKRPATGYLVGNNDPFTWGLGLQTDVCKPYFGSSLALAVADFQYSNVANCKLLSGQFTKIPAADWYSVSIASSAFDKINRVGPTQFRLRFAKDDNDDKQDDYRVFYSGNAHSYPPQLIIQYYVP